MNINICNTCNRFRKIEPQCSCNKAKLILKNYYTKRDTVYKEGVMLYSTFFKKERPRGCKYEVGKKEKRLRTIETCLKCKDFYQSEERCKCTLERNVYLLNRFKKTKPFEVCERKLEQDICYENRKET